MSEDRRMRLELIAAKARQMAQDVGRMWPGDLEAGLAEIRKQLDALERSRG